jgi:uncharacterized delta-60 repeat protein
MNTVDVSLARAIALAMAISASALITAAADCTSHWDATIGQPGFDAPVVALAEFQGELYAGGEFTMAGGAPATGIAKWDGSQWLPVGGGVRHIGGAHSVAALHVFDDGTGPALYAGGAFNAAGETHVEGVARWDGAEWSAVGTPGSPLLWGTMDFTVLDDGSGPALYAAGFFEGGVAKWTGSEWTLLDVPSSAWPNWIRSMEAFEGALYIGGGPSGSHGIEKWEPGQGWSSVFPPGLHSVWSMAVFDDGSGEALYAGSLNDFFGGLVGIGKWNGENWQQVGTWGFLPTMVYAFAVFDDGAGGGPALYAGGAFHWSLESGVVSHSVVKWDPGSQAWLPLPGLRAEDGSGATVHALAGFSTGSGSAPMLHAGGTFRMADGAPANRIARWGCPDPDIFLSNRSVLESQPVGTTVGTLSAVNVGRGEHVFSLVSGDGDAGNSFFTIEGNLLKTSSVFNHETKSSLSIRVRATDADGLFAEKVFLISVAPNHEPTDILLSNSSIEENQPPGTTVGTLSALDPDPGDTHTFTLVSGAGDADNDSFTIEGNLLKTIEVFDRASQSSYSIRVRATDAGGLFHERSFMIGVTASLIAHLDPLFAPELFDPEFVGVEVIAVQDDGRILIGGYFTEVNAQPRNGIARLHPDGSLDTTFEVELDGTEVGVYAIALRGEKMLISGFFTTVNGEPRQGMARLNADGSLDTAFQIEMTEGDEDFGPGIAVIVEQSDGKILIGGEFDSINGQPRHNIARLNTDGSLDESFQNGLEGADDVVIGMALDNDERILIGGYFTEVNGQPRNGIARLDGDDGSLDVSFLDGMAGAEGISFPSVESILVQGDGRILVGGYFNSFNGQVRNRIARLNADGSLDTSFQNGMTGANGGVFVMALDNAGGVVIGGMFSRVNGPLRNGIARLHLHDGSLDTIFLEVTSWTPGSVTAIAVEPSGDILIGGDFNAVNEEPRVGLARLFSGGAPPAATPSISVAGSTSTEIILSWPAAVTDLVPQTTSSLTPPVAWSEIQQEIVTDGDRQTVRIQITSTQQFFRLGQPLQESE